MTFVLCARLVDTTLCDCDRKRTCRNPIYLTCRKVASCPHSPIPLSLSQMSLGSDLTAAAVAAAVSSLQSNSVAKLSKRNFLEVGGVVEDDGGGSADAFLSLPSMIGKVKGLSKGRPTHYSLTPGHSTALTGKRDLSNPTNPQNRASLRDRPLFSLQCGLQKQQKICAS